MYWRIQLALKGGVTHTLRDVRTNNPGWADFNPVAITGMKFAFLGRDEKGKDLPYLLEMSGMESYNFFVEAVKSIGNGKVTIKALWFLGLVPNTNTVTGWVLKDSIMQISTVKGREYKGIATVGWKSGFVNNPPVSIVRKVK
ncbi:MAG: hypothetical protein WC346_00160 [Methanogenium sp.]|jgi:hypothetical protein